MKKTIKFSLEANDPLAALAGLVVKAPVTTPLVAVDNGLIHLTPVVKDEVDLAPGGYFLIYKLAGQGREMKVAIKDGDVTLSTWKIPDDTPAGPHYAGFEVK